MKKSFAAAAREEMRRQIKKSLIEGGVDFLKDFFELSCDTTDKLYSLAVVAGYQKNTTRIVACVSTRNELAASSTS